MKVLYVSQTRLSDHSGRVITKLKRSQSMTISRAFFRLFQILREFSFSAVVRIWSGLFQVVMGFKVRVLTRPSLQRQLRKQTESLRDSEPLRLIEKDQNSLTLSQTCTPETPRENGSPST